MNNVKLNECNRIQNYFRDYILKNYNSNTVYQIISKTLYGYRLERMCQRKALTKGKCSTRWQLCVNIFKSECKITCKQVCSHENEKNI